MYESLHVAVKKYINYSFFTFMLCYVKIKFECRPVLMSKHHDFLWYFTGRHCPLDRLCVPLNMYLVFNKIEIKCESNCQISQFKLEKFLQT